MKAGRARKTKAGRAVAAGQGDLFADGTGGPRAPRRLRGARGLLDELAGFDGFGKQSQRGEADVEVPGVGRLRVPVFVNEFWTAKQRDAHSLHEISYRACFKPQLPRFFIERLTGPGDVVYDPFMGRGTTPLEAALLGRTPMGCDINPLSILLTRPRLDPPEPGEVERRLAEIPLSHKGAVRKELLVFYHPETLRAITAMRNHLIAREASGAMDAVDRWIRMVAVNRLTGHSPGFFSVYTLPPNQAVSVKSQVRINERLGQKPEPRDVRRIILKKSRDLLKDLTPLERKALARVAGKSRLLAAPADATPAIPAGSVRLVVTSPPFLNIVNYATDNWLRCWFCGMDAAKVRLTVPSGLARWEEAMTRVMVELRRVLAVDGHVAFEVGEVRRGTVRLEESVIRCGASAGLEPAAVMINAQVFTKTANCWGVDNLAKGTNTNRIVILRRQGGT